MAALTSPNLDQYGVEHRHGCPKAGWTSRPASLRGFHILTCPTCGAIRLTRGAVA